MSKGVQQGVFKSFYQKTGGPKREPNWLDPVSDFLGRYVMCKETYMNLSHIGVCISIIFTLATMLIGIVSAVASY